MHGAPSSARRGALFLLPVPARGHGPEAAWISTAQWAGAARRRWGASWVVGPDGPVELDDVASWGSRAALRPPDGPTWRRRVPTVLKTASRDLRRVRAGRRYRPDVLRGPWVDEDLVCVWQRHEPFVTAGADAAASLGTPFVAFVPAPIVWEAEAWGVRRPGWGRWFARAGETAVLRRADVVACGSTVVAEALASMGVPGGRLVVTPNGVDVERFAPSVDREATRARLGLGARFVVGWSGSFRGFHGLDLLVDAVRAAGDRLEDIVLLAVGDGAQRPRIERRCRELGVDLVTTGTVGHHEVPALVGAMDVAVVAAGAGEAYHYSPLKLWEYLACGVATVAPALGQPAEVLTDGTDALVVEPGSSDAVADALVRLHDDGDLRRRLGVAARELAVRSLSWEERLGPVERALGAAPSA